MIEVLEKTKNALREGRLPKNYVFVIQDATGNDVITIDNDNLIDESVELDEKLCSDSTFKFGLCEGSSLKFQYFGLPDITGMRIKAFIDVMAEDETIESIPMGFYDVDKCIKDQTIDRFRVIAYNKLKSEYLGRDFYTELQRTEPEHSYSGNNIGVKLDYVTSGFKIERRLVKNDASWTTLFYSEFQPVAVHIVGPNNDRKKIITTIREFNNGALPLMRRSKYILDNKEIRGYCLPNFKLFSNYTVVSVEYLNPNLSPSQYNMDYLDVLSNSTGKSCETLREELLDLAYFSMIGGGFKYYPHIGTTDQYTSEFLPVVGISYEEVYLLNLVCSDKYYEESSTIPALDVSDLLSQDVDDLLADIVSFYQDFSEVEFLDIPPVKEGDITVRQLQSDVFELMGVFGRLDRLTDLFGGIELNHGSLFPAENLYPSNSLIPFGQTETVHKALYKQLLTDKLKIESYRNLFVKYTGYENGQKVDKEIVKQINENGTIDYVIDNNWILLNIVPADEPQVEGIINNLAVKLKDLRFFNYDAEMTGMPHLETGDLIEIETDQGNFPSYILERNLKGIQKLTDNINFGTVETF